MIKLPFTRVKFGFFGHVRCERGWSLDASFQARLIDYDLWYVSSGEGRMQLASGEIPLHAGQCVLMRPGGQYLAQHDPDNPLVVTFIHFQPLDRRGRDKALKLEPPEVFRVRDPRFFAQNAREIVRHLRRDWALSQKVESPAQWLMRTLLFDLLEGAAAEQHGPWSHYRARVEGQAARICEQPGQAPSVRELAREASLSPDHYARTFRQIMGDSPCEFIQKARLDRASQLLRETSLSITEIADECGYADVFQFSRMFKRAMKRAPSHWRR